MRQSVWYCPECQSEGSDPEIEVCPNDGARVRPLASRGAEWIGKVLDGKYRVVRFVDSGGTAEVFEAERITTGKRVAIKLLHAAFARTERARERFLQEAQLVSRIAHPNVVDIIDFGTLPESTHYMVMELLSGQSLANAIGARALPVAIALKYAMQACEGLAAAHERGVIHCDIKPANLFLQNPPDGAEPFVKILDLGIGRLHATEAEDGVAGNGMISGTPEYMSPEQASALPLGPATDIYAMGVVLHELLLGAVPFENPSYTAVLARHLYEEPVWPMDAAQARGVPPEAGPVVLRALSKKQEDRHASMVELQRDIASIATIVRGRHVSATHPTLHAITPPASPRRVSRPEPSQPALRTPARTTAGMGSNDRSTPRGSAPDGARQTFSSGTPHARIHGITPRPSAPARFERVTLGEATGSDREIVEIAPDLYWVGRRQSSALECNTYLRVFRRDGEDLSLLIDPGPARDFEVISAKVAAVIGSIRRLDFVFLNHQDPDVSGNAAAIQKASPRAHVLCSEDTWRIVQSDGLDPRRFTATERFPDGTATLATGHTLRFVPTPFCHFRGAVMLYDPELCVLFSGDLFGGAHAQSLIGAGSRWWGGVEMFHQIYMPSSPALAQAAQRIRELSPAPTVIAPQHGSLIVGPHVGPVVDAIGSLAVGIDQATSAEDTERHLAAVREMVREYAELAGVDKARALLAGQGDECSFTSLFVLRGAMDVAGFKVSPQVAVDALASDALASLSPELRGDMQRTLRSIRQQHGLAAMRAPPAALASTPPRDLS